MSQDNPRIRVKVNIDLEVDFNKFNIKEAGLIREIIKSKLELITYSGQSYWTSNNLVTIRKLEILEADYPYKSDENG